MSKLPPKVTFDSTDDPNDQWQPVKLGETWNGWATPSFDLDEFRKVAKFLELTETDERVNQLPVFVGMSGSWLDTDEDCRPRETADEQGLYTPDGFTFDTVGEHWNDGTPKTLKEQWLLATHAIKSDALYLADHGRRNAGYHGSCDIPYFIDALKRRIADLERLYVREPHQPINKKFEPVEDTE